MAKTEYQEREFNQFLSSSSLSSSSSARLPRELGPLCFYYPHSTRFVEISLNINYNGDIVHYVEYLDLETKYRMANKYIKSPSIKQKIEDKVRKEYAETILSKLYENKYTYFSLDDILSLLKKYEVRSS